MTTAPDVQAEPGIEPVVSIVTVSYNAAATIQRTISSVVGQTYASIEYVVIDGGSTDGTVDIIEANRDNIAYTVSEPDRGIYHAMNKGIRASHGELIGIINSDDWLEPDAVARVVQACASELPAAVLVHGKVRQFDSAGRSVGVGGPSRYPLQWLVRSPFRHPSMFVSRRVYETVGLYDEGVGLAADYDMMLRILRAKVPAKLIDRVVANMQMIGVSTSGGANGGFRDRVTILQRYTGSWSLAVVACSARSLYRVVRRAAAVGRRSL